MQVGCPEEIAYDRGWIGAEAVAEAARRYGKSRYGKNLAALLAPHRR